LKLALIAVGKIKERHVRQAVDDYAERIRHYVTFEEKEIDDGPDAELARSVSKKAKGATLVLLDSRGAEQDSRGFALFVERLARSGKGDIAFAIGGKAGLGASTLGLSPHVLSLSKLTLPHRLARLVLAEQLYRALTILRGEPYGA